MLKITVDFNNLTPSGEQVLVARQGRDDELMKQLTDGMRVLLHEPSDFEVEAIVTPVEAFPNQIWWYGTPDWSTRLDLV